MKYKNTLADERDINGLTLRELAERANVSKSEVSAIERGEKAPNVYIAIRIAGALNRIVEDIWGEKK